MCSASLEGSSAESDAEGVVVFEKLKFAAALPGTPPQLRRAEFACEACASRIYPVSLTAGASGSYQIVFSMKTQEAWVVPDIIEVRAAALQSLRLYNPAVQPTHLPPPSRTQHSPTPP